MKSRRIGKLIVDPTNPKRLWVYGDQGLKRSVDGAVTWTSLCTDPVTDVVLDLANPNTIFIGVRYSGFYKSTDSGTTFSVLPGAPTGATVEFPQIAIGVSGAMPTISS